MAHLFIPLQVGKDAVRIDIKNNTETILGTVTKVSKKEITVSKNGKDTIYVLK